MKTFKDLGVDDAFIKAMSEMDIVQPTAVQRAVLPLIYEEDGDLIGQAQTGTGKTVSFGLPLLNRIDPDDDTIQALVLCPTRELALQVSKQLFKFTKFWDRIFTEAIFGGVSLDQQISALNRTTHVLVATPGRLTELIEKRIVDLSHLKVIVLDEADEMLSAGFKEDIERILKRCANVENKWLFSATLSTTIIDLANKYLSKNAHDLRLSSSNVVNKEIAHEYIICKNEQKTAILHQFLKSEGDERGIIFCRTKIATDNLANRLKEFNYNIGVIHGDLSQKDREKVIRAFKSHKIQYLLATDLAARGLDIPSLAFVVHYQLPDTIEYYTHRSGRTARGGKKGRSLCLIDTSEVKKIRGYERSLGINFKQLKASR